MPGRRLQKEEIAVDLNLCLELMEPSQKVKIGAKHGTGWFYCGTAKRFLNNLAKYDGEIRSYWQNRLYTAWKKLGEAVENRPEMTQTDRLRTWSKNIIAKCDRVERFTEINRNYIPIDEREVHSVRPADKSIDEETVNIVIAGYEEGKFWTFDEAKRAKKYLSMKEGEEDEE